MRFLSLLLFLVLQTAVAGDPVQITLAHDLKKEHEAKAQLERILGKYDVAPFLFTRTVLIESGAIPHSHPVLTLNTRHLDSDELMLSTFLHEQMHWFLAAHPADVALAVQELKQAFPALPVGYPEGAESEESNYEHLIVIDLEYKFTRQLLGDAAAGKVMAVWEGDHYTRLYATVLQHQPVIEAIAAKHGLIF
jgi:uncharacterized protein YijF (DUF1287 family)